MRYFLIALLLCSGCATNAQIIAQHKECVEAKMCSAQYITGEIKCVPCSRNYDGCWLITGTGDTYTPK